MKNVNALILPDGTKPYVEWLIGLKDAKTRHTVTSAMYDLSLGRFGKCKFLSDDIYECKIDYGPGYRVYYAIESDSEKIIILLCGGDKSTQKEDIKLAKKYWKEYKLRAESEAK